MLYAALLSVCAAIWVASVQALEITAPTSGQAVSLANPFIIEWKEETGDASAVSIDLLNASTTNPSPILENIAHNLNTSSGRVNITWPFSIPNDTATYQLYFIATVSGDDIANSGFFNLTLPPGENRSQAEGTVGPYGTHPDSDSAPSATSSPAPKLSGGAIAGIVIGILAFALLSALGAFLFIRRRRTQRRQAQDKEIDHEKPELDGVGSSSHKRNHTNDTFTSTELGADEDGDRKNRIVSGELEGDAGNYLRYELPATPPPPAELADNEIAATEMASPDLDHDDNTSSEESDRIGDWRLRSPVSPAPRRAESMRSSGLSIRSGSTTLGGREVSFAEALHDIVSQELRRKE
ncbi:hypothetical protein LTR08_004192 [Meristemomyces frigidus]|nr:hypothetical protein LTR08_004192 [Meristemomyces frigidus]